jgi:hypothetical protein
VKIKSVLSHSLILATAVLLASTAGFADTIKLKNGSVIKGKVVTYDQQKFTVVIDLGTAGSQATSQIVIAVEAVESIEFDGAEAGAAAQGLAASIDSSIPGPNAKRGEIGDKTASKRAPDAPVIERETTRDPVPIPTDPAPVTPTSATEPTLMAEKTVSVASAADWTSTEIRVRRGQRISITAEGMVDLGGNRRSGPEGVSVSDSRKLIPARPTGALIAVVGDDNDDFVFIGRASEFVSKHDGILFLSVNEGELKDNSGSFLARVKVFSNK